MKPNQQKEKTITPEMAIEILEKYAPNRPLRENIVQIYASDMKNGRWALTHQGIAFNDRGQLYDGQHRLWAIALSGVPIKTTVTRGVPTIQERGDENMFTMDAVDRGALRSTGTQIQIGNKIRNGALVAAAMRSIVLIVSPSTTGKISIATTLAVWDEYNQDTNVVIEMLSRSRRFGYVAGPLIMYHHFAPERATQFITQLCSLDGMSAPVRLYVRWCESVSRSKQQDKNSRILACAIMAFHNEEPIRIIRDLPCGRTFLANMNPSISKRVRELVKHLDTTKLRPTMMEYKKHVSITTNEA
jgi:hypothetical protein